MLNFLKKMGEELGKQRTIDVSVEKTLKSVKSGYRVVPSMEIKAWKAYLTVTFISGFCAALIWSAYMSIYPTSVATENPQVTLFTSASIASHKSGEEFPVQILLNTAGRDIVAVQAIFNYDPNAIQVINVDTSDSNFNHEIKNSVDTGAGQGFLALARPTPGVNSQSAKIAVVNLRALSDVNEPAIRLKFDTAAAVSDSASILDDGLGTNVLQRLASLFPEATRAPETGTPPATSDEFRLTSNIGLTDTVVRLNWSANATGSGNYVIERKLGKADFVKIGEMGSSEAAFTDRSAKPGKTYLYRICQVNEAGEKNCASQQQVKTPGKKKIAKPRVSAQVENGKVNLSWTPTYTTDFSVVVQRSTGNKKKFATLSVVTSDSQNSYLDESVAAGTTYYYRLMIKAKGKKTQNANPIKVVVP